MKKMITCIVVYVVLGIIGMVAVAEAGVTINADFPGGNIVVKDNSGDTVQIAPDLSKNKLPWFYWNFEATADKPGKVSFKGVQIGGQGPAMSLDSGKTWNYMGRDNVADGGFFYNFDKAGRKVRFAVTMPYLQSDFDAFLKESEGNPHLIKSILTKSKKGRDVELIQIGQPSEEKNAVLFTCRHHACEAIASFVLEGFMRTAISDAPEAVEFRKNHVLYVVPFVDKDGVEEGDQGKNRRPHDHNRDYGVHLYPEIVAIEKLGVDKNIRLVMDWHCPTLNMADHQNFYCVGPKNIPVRNYANVSALCGLIRSELPSGAPGGPFNWMRAQNDSTMCTSHFGNKPKIIMSVALEVPYSPRGRKMDAVSCRSYGAAILRAWTKMKFQYEPKYSLSVNGGACEGDGDYIKGTVVSVTANTPPAGQVFDMWTGDTSAVSNVYDATPSVTMPGAAATITATYKKPGKLYTLNVTKGNGSGSYSENAVVDLIADEPAEGQEFVAWVGDTECLVDPKKSVTSITMPTKNVTVTATYKKATLHMMAYWEMEETEGDVVRDSTGNGYDLIPVDGMKISDATTSGKIGNGFTFDGSGKRFTQVKLLDVMPEKLTIVGWVKPDAAGGKGGGSWFSKQNSTGDQLWLKFNMNRGTPDIIGSSFRSDGEFYNCNTNVKWLSDNWYHYAFTWDSSGCQLYINGELKGKHFTPIMRNGDRIDLTIGSGGLKSAPFKGVIDDVRVCEDVLDAREISALYNGRTP